MKKLSNTVLGYLLLYSIIIIHVTGCASRGTVTSAASDSTIRKAIVENDWQFTANYVIPQGARSRQTNDLYTVRFKEGKLIVALPYFGRAWGGAILNTQSPLNFTSADFTVNKENVGDAKWSIEIKPKDYSEVQSLNFSFFENGSASLNVTLTNRSAISFNGYVAAGKGAKDN